MVTLELTATTNGHQTNSSDIQAALLQVGSNKPYDSLHLAAGIYNIDASQIGNKFSVIQINSCSTVFGDKDANGNITTVFRLMDNAPLKPFSCGMPILGTSEIYGHNIEIYNIFFDGNCPSGTTKQNNFANAVCSGTAAGKGNPNGKGLSNFIGTISSSFSNCSFHDIRVLNSAGDGFRTYKSLKSIDLQIFNWDIDWCGHCGILLENSTDCEIHDIDVLTRADGAIRLQNNCSDINIKNIKIKGTSANYDRGMFLSGDNISVDNCSVHSTLGPGIYFQGSDNKGFSISNCEFINCGLFGKSNNYGSTGLMVNGVSGKIDKCYFNGCIQNAISTNFYTPDGGKQYKGSNFLIEISNCDIVDTHPSVYNNPGDGKDIANVLPGHKVTCDKNTTFYPFNHTLSVNFQV
jgi:hypothetical protein